MSEKPVSIVQKNVLPWRGCEKLYLDARTADVYFVFNSKSDAIVKIPAHKNILSSISPVFDAMFYGSLKHGDDIKIVDSTIGAFEKFLQFFYLSTVTLTVEIMPEIMYLAEQYMLNECINACTEFYKETLTLENMCWGYELAIFFEKAELMAFCEQQIIENTEKILHSKSFLECESNILRRILQLDSLNCDESIVFDGCMSWASCVENASHETDKASNDSDKTSNETDIQRLRSRLGNLFYEIRFGEMSLESFYARYRKYDGLFSPNEFKDIIGMIASKDHHPPKFCHRPRNRKKELDPKEEVKVIPKNVDELLICDRFDSSASFMSQKYEVISCDFTVFSSNESIWLTRIDTSELFNDRNHNFTPARMQIFEVSNQNGLYVRQIALSATSETIIDLPHLIEIKKNIKYGIVFQIPFSCYNLLVHHKKVKIGKNGMITFHNHTANNLAISCQKFGIVTRLHFLKKCK